MINNYWSDVANLTLESQWDVFRGCLEKLTRGETNMVMKPCRGQKCVLCGKNSVSEVRFTFRGGRMGQTLVLCGDHYGEWNLAWTSAWRANFPYLYKSQFSIKVIEF